MKWNTRIKILFAACLACFCCSAWCYSAFAYDFDYSFERDLNASQIYSVNGDYFQLSKNADGGVFREGMNWYGDSPLRFDQTSHIHLNFNGSLPAYSLVKIDIFLSEYRNQDYQFRPFCPSSRDGSYTVLDCSYGEYGVVSAIIYIDDEVSVLDLYNNLYYSISGATYTMRVSNASGVKLSSPLTANDLTTLKNAINNNIDEFAQAVDNDFTTIINLLRDTSVQESIASNTERTADLIQSQNEAQQSQYDSEKQEESDREEASSDAMDSIGGMFNFNVLNPFYGIWALFKNNNACVSIPIVAGMLNSSETTYCPWFPATVRNIVTPVLGLSSMMVIFGFFVRWLGSRDVSSNITTGGK